MFVHRKVVYSLETLQQVSKYSLYSKLVFKAKHGERIEPTTNASGVPVFPHFLPCSDPGHAVCVLRYSSMEPTC